MKTAPKIPRWSDDEGVAALVDAEFLEWERLDAMDAVDQVQPGIRSSEIFDSMARDAVEAARRGSFKPLSDMLRSSPENPLTKSLRGKNLYLGSEISDLVADRLIGKHRVARGRPKQTIEQRHANTKVHGAADELRDIEKILQWYYPNEKGIRERAITVAAGRAGIKRKMLENYLRSDRRLP